MLPGRLLHEEMEDSEAQRLLGSTGLLFLLGSSCSFSSPASRKPPDRPERTHSRKSQPITKTEHTVVQISTTPVAVSASATGCLAKL